MFFGRRVAGALQARCKGVAAEQWPSQSVRPVVRHKERPPCPRQLSREEELALKNIEHALAALNARWPVIRIQHLLGMDGALHICAETVGRSF